MRKLRLKERGKSISRWRSDLWLAHSEALSIVVQKHPSVHSFQHEHAMPSPGPSDAENMVMTETAPALPSVHSGAHSSVCVSVCACSCVYVREAHPQTMMIQSYHQRWAGGASGPGRT